MLTHNILEQEIVRYCSPTLAGMKSGSLFSTACSDAPDLLKQIGELNRSLSSKGLFVIPLRMKRKRMLIYVFRRARLAQELASEDAQQLLYETGYEKGNVFSYLKQLCRRMRTGDKFPHEIGLFLSYPPADVKGFIQDPQRICACVGCWKVYSDEEYAEEQFRRYEMCTKIYCRSYAMGASLLDLAVGTA